MKNFYCNTLQNDEILCADLSCKILIKCVTYNQVVVVM